MSERLSVDRDTLFALDSAISYTQWEAYLAVYHGKRLFIAEAARDATREPTTYRRDPQQLSSQQAHRERLRKLMDRWHELRFDGPEDIANKLLPALAGQYREAFAGAAIWSPGIRGFEDYYLKDQTIDGKSVPAPFGGRQRELDHLDRWLDEPGADQRLLVSSPAGRGKSALLVQWMQALKASGEVGPQGWRLVFVPISNRFQTNRPAVYLKLLTRQLAHIAGEHIVPPADDPEPFYRSTAGRLIASLAEAGTPLLLVLDGIDEALGEERLANLLPALLPSTLKVLASARWIAGDGDARGWLTRLGWIGTARPPAHDLVIEPLDVPGIADVLARMGAPIDAVGRDWTLVQRLAVLTEGEPLLLRFYAEDLWLKTADRRPITLYALETMQPGLGPYFEAWLHAQGGVEGPQGQGDAGVGTGTEVDPRTTDATLAILGFARGPLPGNDLLAIGGAGFPDLSRDWRLVASPHVATFRRFVIGDGSDKFPYAFSHPKVGDYIRTRKCAGLADQTETAFFVWGREQLVRLNAEMLRPEKASGYMLDYYADHLRAVADSATVDDYLAMVEDGWRRAKERRDGGPAGFAADVRTTWRAIRAREGEVARLGAQWRCALTLSSIRSVGANIPGTLLVELVRCGNLSPEQARHYAEMKGPEEDAVTALADIATLLVGQPRLALEMASAAIALASAASDEKPPFDVDVWGRAGMLALVLAHLQTPVREAGGVVTAYELLDPIQRADATTRALAAAKAIHKVRDRAEALTALIPHLDPDKRSDVLAAAQTIADKALRSRTLAALLPHLAPAQRADALAEALAAANEIDDSWRDNRVEALALLAPYLDATQRADALATAKTISFEAYRCDALAALAPYFDPAQRRDALIAALAAAKEYDNKSSFRDEGRAAFASLFDLAQRAAPPDEVLAAAKGITDNESRSGALVRLAPYLDPAERTDALASALAAAKVIGDKEVGSRALAAVLVALIRHSIDRHQHGESLAKTVTAAEAINDEEVRSHALASLIPALAALALRVDSVQRADGFAKALTTAQTTKDDTARAHALASIAPVLTALAPDLDATCREDGLALVVAAAKATNNEDARSYVLRKLAPTLAALALHLEPTHHAQAFAEALALAKEIKDDDARSSTLTALAPHLHPAQCADALAGVLPATMVIGDHESRSYALGALVPFLEPVQRADALAGALAAARAIREDLTGPRALAALAPYLEPAHRADAFAETLATAKSISDQAARSHFVLWALAPVLLAFVTHLDASQRRDGVCEILAAGKAVSNVLSIDEDTDEDTGALIFMANAFSSRIFAPVLAALAPHLDSTQCADGFAAVLDAANAVSDEFERSQALDALAPALAALAPHLDFAQCADGFAAVLDVTNAMTDESHRSHALVALAPALAALIPHLHPAQRRDALAAAIAATNLDGRARPTLALGSCAASGTQTAVG
jgi:hypothetical protein